MDVGLIAAAQRVEHYEIAAYGTARAHAEVLGHKDIYDLLQTTLDEEGMANKKLTQLAEGRINIQGANEKALA
jgi:ferritin-like metal-binding protein YciE